MNLCSNFWYYIFVFLVIGFGIFDFFNLVFVLCCVIWVFEILECEFFVRKDKVFKEWNIKYF